MRKITTHIQTIISELEIEGIKFSFDQQMSKIGHNEQRLENVIFEKNGVQCKIYEGVFFRDFGQCKYFKKMKGGEIMLVDLDNITFYETQKTIILKYFEKRNE